MKQYLYVVFCVSSILIATMTPDSAASEDEFSKSREFAKAFRDTEPFLTQGIVVSNPGTDGTRSFLLTEPPTKAFQSRKSWLREIYGDAFIRSEVVEYPVGFDGKARDIVVQAKLLDFAQVEQVVRKIHKEFFGTDYKAVYRVFNPKPWNELGKTPRRQGPPNFEIDAASLHDWLYGPDKVAFSSDVFAENTPRADTLPAASLPKGQFGIYYSQPSGLVALMVPVSRPLNDAKPILRQFFVDTDLIIGAVTDADANWLLLIGRERTTPLDEAEPLRIDTVLTLAASRKTDLAQSYQRTMPFAGKVTDPSLIASLRGEEKAKEFKVAIEKRNTDPEDPAKTLNAIERNAIENAASFEELLFYRSAPLLKGAVDWAPILLSQELTHTEYGQLLNITDQMLKSWSSGNRIDYARFPYPTPYGNPDARGLFERLQSELNSEFSSLTFNWNTAGFGSWTQFGNKRIFTLYRTGSLPVSYFPDDGSFEIGGAEEKVLKKAEDDYWEFFSSLRDPYLIRAAQYAALHIIFQEVNVSAKREEALVSSHSYKKRWTEYSKLVLTALQKMAIHTKNETHPLDEADSDLSGTVFSEQHCVGDAYSVEDWKRELPDKRNALLFKSAHKLLAGLMTDPEAAQNNIIAAQKQLVKRSDRLGEKIDEFNEKIEYCRNVATSSSSTCDFTTIEYERDRLNQAQNKLIEDGKAFEQQADRFESYFELVPSLSREMRHFGDCSSAWRSVVDSVPSSSSSIYHTPGIVVSDKYNDFASVGGTNLDGRSVNVIIDNALDTGAVKISPDGGTIRISPADRTLAQSVGRTFERDFKRYSNGSAAFKARVKRQVEATLAQDKRAIQQFDVLAQARSSNTTSNNRGYEMPANSNGSFFRPAVSQPFKLTPSMARDASEFAGLHEANLVISRSADSNYLVLFPNGKPPMGISVRSQADIKHALETLIPRAARQGDVASGEIVVIERGGVLSPGDMHAIMHTGIGQTTGGGGGGGFITPPNGPRGGFFYGGSGGGGKPPRKIGFWSRNPLKIPYRKTLKRIDADWSRVTVESVKAVFKTANETTMVAKMKIPFKIQERPSLTARFFAVFKGEAPSKDVVAKSWKDSVETVARDHRDEAFWRLLEETRQDFKSKFTEENIGKTFYIIQDTSGDFYVVERKSVLPGPHERHRG